MRAEVSTSRTTRLDFRSERTETDWDLRAIVTTILWLGALVVGVVGLEEPYTLPKAPPEPEQPIVERVQVELTENPIPVPDQIALPTPQSATPPPPPDVMQPPPAPRAIKVEQPSPAVAFALPVQGPVRVVESKRAEYVQPAVTNAPAPTVQPLTFGLGEGKQAAPEYPLLSRRQGQEGTVLVRISISETGRVLAAEVQSPSSWPLLNDAALRVVREKWRFRAGPPCIYDVPIEFHLAR